MIVQYRGYLVSGSSIPQYDQRSSQALGIICVSRPDGSLVEVKRIEGPIMEGRQKAEDYGLQLCKEWLDDLAWLFELWVALRPAEEAERAC
jgi:hypothetical protein